MTDPAPNTGLLLFYPYRALESRVLAALATAGFEITVAQARLLQRVAPGGSRLTDLAAQAQVTKQTAGALVDELQPQPGDIVIPKTRYSGFFNTNIDSVLRARGIRNLVFTGVATNVCVESSLRDAFHLEYFAVVLEDATHHAGPAFVQQAALYNIETFFGWVSTVADFCGAIGQAAPPSIT